jgi:hypothetical protein
MEPVLEARLCMSAAEFRMGARQFTVYENICHQRYPTYGRNTHIPHSNSSYHSSLGTILSISSNVLMTLGALGLTVPVGVDCDCVWDIADFGGPVFVRVLPPGEGGGLFVNLTLGDVGDVGDVTVSSISI